MKKQNLQKNKILKHCANCLFTAAKNIRECLDTIKLQSIAILDLAEMNALEIYQKILERLAQKIQKETL